MLAQYGTLRAFRPSSFADEDGELNLHDMTRLENIKRYARMVSLGLRLFEDSPPSELPHEMEEQQEFEFV